MILLICSCLKLLRVSLIMLSSSFSRLFLNCVEMVVVNFWVCFIFPAGLSPIPMVGSSTSLCCCDSRGSSFRWRLAWILLIISRFSSKLRVAFYIIIVIGKHNFMMPINEY